MLPRQVVEAPAFELFKAKLNDGSLESMWRTIIQLQRERQDDT